MFVNKYKTFQKVVVLVILFKNVPINVGLNILRFRDTEYLEFNFNN